MQHFSKKEFSGVIHDYKDFEITERLGTTFEELFNELENEYSRIAAEDLDPRYVQMFLLK